jgi:hypothetical protein
MPRTRQGIEINVHILQNPATAPRDCEYKAADYKQLSWDSKLRNKFSRKCNGLRG